MCTSSYHHVVSQFGVDHPQSLCSKEFLCTITKQAVKVERSLRQTGADGVEPPVEVCPGAHVVPDTRNLFGPYKVKKCVHGVPVLSVLSV